MSSANIPLHLPEYPLFIEAIASLDLPISGSELHGVMCGYLCAGAVRKGENYLRALLSNKNNPADRTAMLALFGVYAVSQQQLSTFNFEFQLLLPDDQEELTQRAQAFSEWCDGFTQGITLAGIDLEQLHEDEARDALHHLIEFAQMDYDALQADEENERALMEINEYARMAVMHIYSDLQTNRQAHADVLQTH